MRIQITVMSAALFAILSQTIPAWAGEGTSSVLDDSAQPVPANQLHPYRGAPNGSRQMPVTIRAPRRLRAPGRSWVPLTLFHAPRRSFSPQMLDSVNHLR